MAGSHPKLKCQKIPNKAGLGLREVHAEEFEQTRPDVAWLEIHSENYLSDIGPGGGHARLERLMRLRSDYPMSCHSVGISLGSADGVDKAHLKKLRTLYDYVQPSLVSDHLAWSIKDGVYMNDLLPIPYTDESLKVMCQNIETAQDILGRKLLIENPSSYVGFNSSHMTEWEFLSQLPKQTGCGILLDVNNIYVSAHNHKFDIDTYINAIDFDVVEEIHISGHALRDVGGQKMRIDDHGSAPIDDVWDLLVKTLGISGPRPVLMEWDRNLPDLEDLLTIVNKADRMLAGKGRATHAA